MSETAAPAARTIPAAFIAEVRARTPIAALIGRDVRLARAGRLWRGCCPFHGEKNPSFYVYADHYHCFGCGAHGDAIRFLTDAHRFTFVDAVRELAREAGMAVPGDNGTAPARPRATLAPMTPPPEDLTQQYRAAAQQIWLAAQPSIIDTPVENYLLNRGIDLRRLGRVPRALRFHSELYHAGSKLRMPAMVAAISAADGTHAATHRTWLEYAGGGWMKARVRDNKMVLGGFAGGCIRLWRGASRKPLKDAPAGEPVVIAEGIESCLSIVQALPELRVLCAVSQGHMGAVELPPRIGVVILAIDNDIKAASHAAAARVAERWIQRGFNVRIARSPAGNDFNDALMLGGR